MLDHSTQDAATVMPPTKFRFFSWFWRWRRQRKMKVAELRILRDIGVRQGVAEAMDDAKHPYWIS